MYAATSPPTVTEMIVTSPTHPVPVTVIGVTKGSIVGSKLAVGSNGTDSSSCSINNFTTGLKTTLGSSLALTPMKTTDLSTMKSNVIIVVSSCSTLKGLTDLNLSLGSVARYMSLVTCGGQVVHIYR